MSSSGTKSSVVPQSWLAQDESGKVIQFLYDVVEMWCSSLCSPLRLFQCMIEFLDLCEYNTVYTNFTVNHNNKIEVSLYFRSVTLIIYFIRNIYRYGASLALVNVCSKISLCRVFLRQISCFIFIKEDQFYCTVHIQYRYLSNIYMLLYCITFLWVFILLCQIGV